MLSLSLNFGDALIQTGFWVNEARGRTAGTTLTLGPHSSSFLVAFLSVYAGFVFSQLWAICVFVGHQWRSSRDDRDGLHHQMQVVLRSTRTPQSAAGMFVHLWWNWRGVLPDACRRCWSWVAFASLFFILTLAGSVMVGFVTWSEQDIRRRLPKKCGLNLFESSTMSVTALDDYTFQTLNETLQAASYVQRCYNPLAGSVGCGGFVKQSLELTTNANEPCPFPGYCQDGEMSAFSVSTGLIDSREHLGVNTNDSGRVAFQKRQTCAPLVLKDFLNISNSSIAPTFARIDVNMGPLIGTNTTYSYETVGTAIAQGWGLDVVTAQSGGGIDWDPVWPFNVSDADVTVIFVTPNGIVSNVATFDPIFGTSLLVHNLTLPDGTVEYYYGSPTYVGAMGCVDQVRVCQANGTGCTPWDGGFMLASHATDTSLVTFNAIQLHTVERLSVAMYPMQLANIIGGRGAAALQLTGKLSGLLQGLLPNNQWTIEVFGWAQTALAILQQSIASYVDQPVDSSQVTAPSDDVGREACHQQLTNAVNGTVSFSVLGLGIILGLGLLIILISSLLGSIVGFFQQLGARRHDYKRLAYIQEDDIHLQMQVYDAMDLGINWIGLHWGIPITLDAVKFGGWDLVDDAAPTLHQARQRLRRIMRRFWPGAML
ncbi:hypothetical protein ANO11243_061450 [Dothideomycetidae sp. 11243]|nr:hypothetical protein ANO11243_061450 [fungal sp. No.11243]